MPLARAWWRGSAWALAATLVVPGALAIAVATIALGGGLRSLGAVAQIVTGPQVPETQLGDRPGRTAATTRATHLPSVPRTATSRPTTTRAFRAPGAATTAAPRRSTASGPTASTGPARPVTRRPATGSSPAAQQPSRPQASPQPGAPATGPAAQPDDPVRQVGKAAAGTVGSAVPAPAGPAAADAVTTVLDLVDPPNGAASAVRTP